jgi:cytochrome c-type biogenesis protein CcmH/NrfG
LSGFDRANEAYKQALNIDPQYAEAQNSLGVLLCRQKQFEDGIHLFQEVLRLAKDNLEARYNLALAYEYASQPEKARDAWQAYLIFDDKSDWADRARGHLGE